MHVCLFRSQISEEEGRLKKDEEETKEMWKRKREHEEQWEGTREERVCSISSVLYSTLHNFYRSFSKLQIFTVLLSVMLFIGFL